MRTPLSLEYMVKYPISISSCDNDRSLRFSVRQLRLSHFLFWRRKMTNQQSEEMHRELAFFKNKAREIQDRMQADGNSEKTKAALEREYSITLFKCAVLEGLINREE